MNMCRTALYVSAILFLVACNSDDIEYRPLPDAATTIQGTAVLKALPAGSGWILLHETLQPQYLVTMPRRQLSWCNEDFSEARRYTPDAEWSLIDAVTHPSGETSAISVYWNFKEPYPYRMKIFRFKRDDTAVEFELESLPFPETPGFVPPGSMDRMRLVAYGEDLYVVARWAHSEVVAYRFSFDGSKFLLKWVRWVEPSSYLGTLGIIGGGFDNFHQGDYHFFVYADVDSQGNLYVAVPGSEEVVGNHDAFFGENLLSKADPSVYDFGMAVVTKFSPQGNRTFSTLVGGNSRYKRLLNMRVGDQGLYLVGRVKTSMDPNGWDAWLLSANLTDGAVKYENVIDIKDGDMFWDISPLPDGRAIAVGCTGYTQNPSGLSVSDARTATACLLDAQGKLLKEIALPQGPPERGNEAMSVSLTKSGNAVFSGVHNAPGTHASVYTDGFVAVRSF